MGAILISITDIEFKTKHANMLYYKTEEKMYQNRLQLAEKIGTRMYNKEVRHGNIIFINDQDFKQKVKEF